MHRSSSSKGLKSLNVNYIMHKTGICTVYVISTGLKLEITNVHLRATQSMLQPSSWPREPYTKIHKHGLITV